NIAAAEAELVSSFDPTDIIGNIVVRSGVGQAVDGIPAADRESITRHSQPYCRSEERTRVHAEILPGAKIVWDLRPIHAVGAGPQRVHDACSDQVGVSKRERVNTEVALRGEQGQRILAVI